MEKKEVSVNTVVKSIITGFVSYGIIFYVMVVLLLVIAESMTANVQGLKIESTRMILSVIFAIFCFVLVRFTCRVSTMDVFKKCIMNPESYGRVVKKMTFFYVVCIAMTIFTGVSLLNLNLKYERAEIAYYKVFNSEVFSQDYVEELEQDMNEQYNNKKNVTVKSTVIVELGIVLSFISLINYQRKMLLRYNEYDKANVTTVSIENVENAENVANAENTENDENTENTETIEPGTDENSSQENS